MPHHAAAHEINPRPLVVDLDGTLIRSDMLVESFFLLFSANPLAALTSLPLLLREGRAAFKASIAEQVAVDAATLPYSAPLLEWLRAQKAGGRKLYLASASNRRYVQAVADYLGIFDGIFASDAAVNLRAEAKAEALNAAFGAKNYDYVGNSDADLAVWAQAAGVIYTNASSRLVRAIEARFPAATMIAVETAGVADYLRAMRPHQWLKNLLVFVPMLAAQQLDGVSFGAAALAFVCFSLCASAGYILNDLMDLRHDREHPSKRLRPLPSGLIGLRQSAQLMLVSFAASITLGMLLPASFLGVLLLYFALTLAYSTFIKRQMVLDVILLSQLYNLRLFAGGAALAIPISPWLLSFASFMFLSLALLKRCAELVARALAGKEGEVAGRNYRAADTPMLFAMAAAAGYVAALTSGLYIHSPKVLELYRNPEHLWAIPLVLMYWVSRLLMLTHRGEMLEDPVLFAARDRVSMVCGALILAVLLASS